MLYPVVSIKKNTSSFDKITAELISIVQHGIAAGCIGMSKQNHISLKTIDKFEWMQNLGDF